MSMCITVSAIEMKPKRCIIVTTEGRRLGCYAEKVAKFGFEVGASYNVETAEVQYGDTLLTNIASAKRVTVSAATAAARQAAPAAAGAAFRTPEQMFASELIVAYINSGRCPPEGLTKTIDYIRKAWRETFGNDDAYPYDQAAE